MLAKKKPRDGTFELKVIEGENRAVARGISVLAEGCTFQGKMFLQGEARLAGKVEGTVISNGTLIIEESAHIKGDICGAKVLVCGTVEGTIQTTGYLQLTPTCKVTGDLSSPRLVVEDGARLNGRVSYVEDNSKKDQSSLTAVKK